MPELPEVERARATVERAALGRRIVGVDDSDTHVWSATTSASRASSAATG